MLGTPRWGAPQSAESLPIPPLMTGTAQDGVVTYDLTAQPGTREFLPGLQTETWGYNGDFLGPALLLRRGDQVVLNVTNNIDITTTTHWHGMHVPAVMDGGPHQRIEPGATWTATFPVLNRAATYWYHPHPHPQLGQGVLFDPMGTGYQVYQGLAGLLIVEDDTSDALVLPRSYGQDDIPLILQDRRFHEDGSLMHFPSDFNPATDPALRKGGHFLVNGVEAPVLDVGAQVVRLRILNASNARVYNLGFSDNRTFHQVVSDGGFLPAPVSLSRLLLAPAERVEILLNLGADEGQTLTLRSFNSENGTTFVPPPLQDQWDTTDFDLLEIRIGSATANAVRTIPEALSTVDRIPETDAANADSPRPFELNANPFGINGKRMNMAIIDARIRLGDTEVWEITNPNSQAHPFHVHGDSFQVLSRDGAPPPAQELGWKDVVLVRPFETVHIIKRFHDYSDPVTPYMFHCHILEHEDVGMMGQFVVEEIKTSCFAHAVVAGGYSTTFTIVNTGDTTANGDLILTHRSGDPLSVIMEGLPSESETGQRLFAEGSSFPVSIPSGGSVFMTATAVDPSQQAESGWARVEYSGGSLHGVSTFQLVENSILQTIAGVLASQPQDAVTIPVDNDAAQNRFTGFAVANFTGDEINLRLVTLDANGTVTDSISPDDLNPLGAHQQVAKFLHEYIPSKQIFKGTMVLMTEGGEQFVAAALIINQALLTATPVIPGRVSSIPN